MSVHWLFVPIVTIEDPIDGERPIPKYTDRPEVRGYGIIELDDEQGGRPTLPWAGNKAIVVMEFADTPEGETAYQEIAAKNDAVIPSERGQSDADIADWLNKTTDAERTLAEWQTFLTGGRY